MTTSRRPRVLLALPRYRGPNHAPFVGIACLAASLKRSGADVAVFDEDVAADVENESGVPASDLLERVLREFAPTLVGIHVNTPNYASALSLVRRIRAEGSAPVVAGGPHATLADDLLARQHVDYVLRGEADATLPQLAFRLARGLSVREIPGLSWATGDAVTQNPCAPLLDVATLPLPDRTALLSPPIKEMAEQARATYAKNFYRFLPGFQGRSVASAYVSRGCPHACDFCAASRLWADPLGGNPIRRVRPVEFVLHELADLVTSGFGAVFFDEPTFPMASEPQWNRSFCDALIASGLDLRWGAPTHLDEIDFDLAKRMHAAGCRYLYVGVETPHPELLRGMNKRVAVDRVAEAFARLESIGIHCDASILFGGPGETADMVDRTLAWLDASFPKGNAFFSMAALWPGTPWSSMHGLTAEAWEPSCDRRELEEQGIFWYGEHEVSLEKFFSNSTGTYHLASVEQALEIRRRILESGFRERFSRYSRQGAASAIGA